MGELPSLRKLVERFREKPFALVGVATDGDRDTVLRLLQRDPVPWRTLADGGVNGPLSKTYNVRGWPSVWVLDAKGVIRHRDLRGRPLAEAVEKLLEEAKR